MNLSTFFFFQKLSLLLYKLSTCYLWLQNMDLENTQEDTRPIEELLELINGKGKGVVSKFLLYF